MILSCRCRPFVDPGRRRGPANAFPHPPLQQLPHLQQRPPRPSGADAIAPARQAWVEAWTALHEYLERGGADKDTLVRGAGEAKQLALPFMLLCLQSKEPGLYREALDCSQGLLYRAWQRSGQSTEDEFKLLESAPPRILAHECDLCASELRLFLASPSFGIPTAVALAGKIKWLAQRLMLHLLGEYRQQELKAFSLKAEGLLNDAWRRAQATASEFSLLEGAPAPLLKALAPARCEAAMSELHSLLSSGGADPIQVTHLAGQFQCWTQWLMLGLLEQGRVADCDAVARRAMGLLGQAQGRARGSMATQFVLLGGAPCDLLTRLEKLGLLRDAPIITPAEPQQHLQGKGFRLNTPPPGASLRPATPEVPTATVPVGQKRSQEDAGIGKEVQDGQHASNAQWSAEAKVFTEKLQGLFKPCIENATVERFAEFAACGNAGICYLRGDEKLCKEFTKDYLLLGERARSNLKGQVWDGFRLALLNAETPRSVVVTLGRAAQGYGHESVVRINMVETIHEASAMPQAFPDLDRGGVERAFRPSGGWPAMPRFDGMRLIERFGEPWDVLLDCIKVLRKKLNKNYTAEGIIEFAEYGTAAICFLDQHAGSDACDKFTREYLNICSGICRQACKSLGTKVLFDKLFLNPAHTPSSVVSALDRARRTAELDLLGRLIPIGIPIAIEQAVKTAACKPRTWDQFLKLVRPGDEDRRRIDEIRARVAMSFPPT